MKIPHFNRNHLGLAALVLWIPAIIYSMTLFTATHVLTLPPPEDALKLERGALTLIHTKGWHAIHTLMGGCECSRDVGQYLVSRGRSSEYESETVLLVDADYSEGERYQQAGFRTEFISGETLVRTWGVQAAPSLVVLNPSGKIAYTGGYYERSARVAVLDLPVLRRLKRGDTVKPLPLFGCGIGQRLQSAIDPMGLKYERTEHDNRKEKERAHEDAGHTSEVSDVTEGKDQERAPARHSH